MAAGVLLVLTGCAHTSLPHLSVRSGPGTSYPVTATIRRSGTAVAVVCWLYGSPVRRDRVWYEIRSPVEGYVTNYYIAHPSAFAGASHC